MLIHPGRAVLISCVVWIVVAVHSEVVIFKHKMKNEENEKMKKMANINHHYNYPFLPKKMSV